MVEYKQTKHHSQNSLAQPSSTRFKKNPEFSLSSSPLLLLFSSSYQFTLSIDSARLHLALSLGEGLL